MDDATLLTLCVWSEARGQGPEGKAAVARVVLNRIAAKFESDGTIKGTVLAPNQFSGFWWGFNDQTDKYDKRLATTVAQASKVADAMLKEATDHHGGAIWAKCEDAVTQVMAGTFKGSLYDQLGDEAVNYVNLRLAKPKWATPELHIIDIGAHSFYRRAA